MRGNEAIIRMRLRHIVPAIVFVDDYPCHTDWDRYGDHATVSVFGDMIHTLDFRFLKGLRVSTGSANEDRARMLFERIKDAGARMVGACHIKPDYHVLEQDGWAEVWVSQEVDHG